MKKFILGAVAAMLLVAPAADAKAFRGTVVKKGTRSVVVATRVRHAEDRPTSRRSARHAAPRQRQQVSVVGHATRAHISGVVRGNTATRVVLSSSRTTVSVKPRRHHGAGDALMSPSSSGTAWSSRPRSHEDNDVDEAEIRGIATVDAAGVHLQRQRHARRRDDPGRRRLAAIQAFNGMFVEVEFDVVNGVNVLRKIKAEDDDRGG